METLFKALFSPAHFEGPNGFKIEGPVIWALPVFLAFLGALFVSFVWVYRDASRRGKNELLTLLFILLAGWPLSFLWWLWLRPSIANKEN